MSKKKIIDTMEKIPLEDSDIRHFLGNNQPIKVYSELSKYTNIDQLLPNNNSSVVLLYEQQENSGHWCCVKKLNNTIQYFNSYGGKIDAPLIWSKKNNSLLGQGKPFLSELFNKCQYDIFYNTYSYQNPKNINITTCGLHVCSFILSGLDLKNYQKQFLNLKKKTGLSNDELITNLMIKNT